MKNPVLVTGATGTVGKELVATLVQRRTPVRALVHDMNKADGLVDMGVEISVGDLHDPEQVRRAMDGVEKVYLLIPAVQDMLEMTKVVKEEAERMGVRKIVKHSLINCDATPYTVFGQAHFECEKLLRRSSMGFTFLRPNMFMQNFVNFIGEGIRKKDVIAKPCGDGRSSFVDARDIAEAAASILDGNWHDGKTYSITGPEALSNAEVAELIGKVAGRTITYVDMPEDEYRRQMLGYGMPEWTVNGMMDVMATEKHSRAAMVTKDYQHITGLRPRTFAQFAQDHASAFAKA
ncbi:MAG: NmrA-like family protein [Methanomassiliicoccales archaeon PtaU1.Bin124]|nr:MAG: NmrA-like family protein [Methanomassiliicoccales archaeon PtaU1.Bin124]